MGDLAHGVSLAQDKRKRLPVAATSFSRTFHEPPRASGVPRGRTIFWLRVACYRINSISRQTSAPSRRRASATWMSDARQAHTDPLTYHPLRIILGNAAAGNEAMDVGGGRAVAVSRCGGLRAHRWWPS